MKYRAVYKALEGRWKVSPGFRYTDLSGWRNPGATYHHYRPLWVVVEDRASMRRIWLTHTFGVMEISWVPITEKGAGCGEIRRVRCDTQVQMAREFEKLFAQEERAA